MQTLKNNNLDKAIQLCNNGAYEEALPYYDKVLTVIKDNGDIYRMKAQALMMLGRNKEAIDVNIEALNIDPKNVWTLILMGNIFSRERDTEAAVRYYEEALMYHPNDAIAINNVGAAYMQQSLFDKAIETFKKALSVDDTYYNTYYGLATAYSHKHQDLEAWKYLEFAHEKAIQRKENPEVVREANQLKVAIARRIVDDVVAEETVDKVVKELQKEGGLEIKLKGSPKMSLSAKLEYAPLRGRDYHLILYNPSKEYRQHLVLHELTHLRMNLAASKLGTNEVPVTEFEQINDFHQRFAYFFNKISAKLGKESADKIETDLRNGLSLQLFNCPLDLLVEDYIFRNHKEMRPMQLLSLLTQEEENINSVQAATKFKDFPPAVVRANKIMNIVSSLHFEALYGINLQNYYKPTKAEFEIAKDLYAEYEAYRDDYQPGEEYELCRYFIETFDFEKLVVWTNEKSFDPSDEMITKAKLAMQDVGAEEIKDRNKEFAKNHKDGDNPEETMMMAMYMLAAMQRFDGMSHIEVKKIAMEIATIGMTGINPSNTSGYKVPSLGDEDFGGYRLLAFYYVSFAREIPELLPKLGLPFSKAYETALQMYEAEGGKK